MIDFPVLNWLRVDGYSLYPGDNSTKGQGLFVDLSKDLSLIVGANGLGKSTMLNIAFRLLTGPFDIPGAARSGELGSARLDVTRHVKNREFAARVSDGAQTAEAAISFALGEDEFLVVRALSDEHLISWSLNGEVGEPQEALLQASIASSCGVYSFADWILVLRYVTFYLDDRQVLFWDPSAQKQLLRSLFLPPGEAQDWVTRERRVLTIDSKHRNQRNSLNQASRDLAKQLDPGSSDVAQLRARLLELLDEAETATGQTNEALSDLSHLEHERADANLARLTAQIEADRTFKLYESAKLEAISSKFPDAAESARFIWSQLISDGICLTCGGDATELAQQIEDRLASSRCAICGSPAREPQAENRNDSALWDTVQNQRILAQNVEERYRDLAPRLDAARVRVAELERRREERENEIEGINARMPKSETAYRKHRDQVAVFKSMLEATTTELRAAAQDFESFVQQRGKSILKAADDLKENFERYAKRFLLDEGELVWAPREELIGQSSYKVVFPAYELRLRRNDGGNISLRSGPGDVSESQKEFVDLAFRMALIKVAGNAQNATIVVDTPESSLDSVFSARAAGVLSDFVGPDSACRLLVASNLTDGRLIPTLVREIVEESGEVGVLNLLKVARATPAVEQLGAEYDEAYDRLLSEAGLSDGGE